MSRNGSGTYSLPAGNPVATGTTISSTDFNNTMTDIATALTQSIAKDGQTTPTANLPMGTYKLTGLGAGSAATDSANLSQVQSGVVSLLGGVAGTNTITATGAPTVAAYASGQTFRFIPAATNTGATTLNIDSLGAKNVYANGVACIGGELVSGVPTQVMYDGTQFNIVGPFNGVINKNVGIGVTLNTWGSDYKALQAKNGASFAGGAVTLYAINNGYIEADNSTYRRVALGTACLYASSSGSHNWYAAGSDAAGSAISWANLFGSATQATSSGASAQNSCLIFYKDTGTSRSINAAGTINASGADYAEYERNNGLTIAKGQIVGFKADGTITLAFSEALRFGVKSSNPSYVGGDTWGNEDAVGPRPIRPAENAPQELMQQYAAEAADFEARLEAARQQVDRIAYAGKVPVNVFGATPGDYIIATELDGGIAGMSVTDPDFQQYKKAVGRVNRILEDGRAEIAVIVH